MRSVRFPVVTGIVLILAVLCLVRRKLEGYIAPWPANLLKDQPGDYLERAVHQPVTWRPFGEAAIQESRQKSRPMLILVGTPWSAIGRFADRQLFSAWSVANVINQSFIPIRVDGMQDPRWQTAIFPLLRTEAPFTPGFQMYVYDTRGRLVRRIDGPRSRSQFDQNDFSDKLLSAANEAADAALSGDEPQWAAFQRSDLQILKQGSTGSSPAFDAFAEALPGQVSKQTGAFLQGDVKQMLPGAWLFQLRAGRIGDLDASLGRFLESPSVDVVRGGFFRCDETADSDEIDFDQITTSNAEMAQLLAETYVRTREPIYDWLARATFDMLVRDMRTGSLFNGCRVGDEDDENRSPSASYPDSRTQGYLRKRDEAWAAQNLCLDAATNPQMTPYFKSKAVVSDGGLNAVLSRLRQVPSPAPEIAEQDCLDVNGKTAACLLRCARLWDDRVRLTQALETVGRLSSFNTKGALAHNLAVPKSPEFLDDDLAYCDAELNAYLCTGNTSDFRLGLNALRRMMELFAGRQPGVWLTATSNGTPLGPIDIDTPELLDGARESCTAQAIRLFADYGRMLGDTPLGRRLLAAASDTVERFAQPNIGPNAKLGGYYTSAASFADPECAFAVGPRAQELADDLFRERPSRLVAAVGDLVRPDLAHKKPGLYVVKGAAVSGPWTADQAARLIPVNLQIGVRPN
ncbi:MAG TPA: DUF255 domain-containing protein [Fimbriimonas sp.]|nr:DUF255 domain-containing protein [Fimbriimonas sp.]